MKQIIFKLMDNKAKTVIVIGNGRTNEDIVRKNLAWISAQFPLRDVDIIDTGYRVDMDSGSIELDEGFMDIVIPWTCYEFPKDKAENITSVGLKYGDSVEPVDTVD